MMHGEHAPFGAMPDDTAEYMLGNVHVTVVLMESNTQISSKNNNSENWTSTSIGTVKQRIQEGLKWWKDTLATKTTKHELNFQVDFTNADSPVSTSYEPITRSSNDFQFWVYDFLNIVGYNTRGNFHDDLRAFNNAQREANHTDWAYTIFVVNDEKDSDHQFAPGGFSKAFAFAGGEALISPASRPASTYSHESGHQFWALDEYQPDGDFDRFRGYYDTQNLNSWDNPTFGFQQKPSIMSNGASLDTAYATHASAVSTLEMIGWKDSDGDGVFDVLDVPLLLTGSGYYDEVAGEYRFTGTSSVQTLPNRNSSGLKNDITINKVSRAEFRVDGGAWQTAATYGTAIATLDLKIPIANGASQIDIRTVDDKTGMSSPVFLGLLDRPAGVLAPGINGIVWRDQNRDGLVDGSESGFAGAIVQVVDQSGQPLGLRTIIEPDDYASKTPVSEVVPGITLSAFGGALSDSTVAAFSVTSSASTGSKVFASKSSQCGTHCTDWTSDSRQLRIEFDSPISTLSLDAIGTTVAGYGRIEIYDSNSQLLARYTTDQLDNGEVEQMTLSHPTAEIKYAIARGHAGTAVRFDNLQIGASSTTTTDDNGAFSLAYLPEGTYNVRVVTGPGRVPTNPASATQVVTLANGEFKAGADFGITVESSPWQNAANRFDVNTDNSIAPLDVLAVINSLNRGGTRTLTVADTTPPYVDVNGDFQLAPIDALQIINLLNRGGTGEGESTGSTGGSNQQLALAEGEHGDALVPGPPLATGEDFVGPYLVFVQGASNSYPLSLDENDRDTSTADAATESELPYVIPTSGNCLAKLQSRPDESSVFADEHAEWTSLLDEAIIDDLTNDRTDQTGSV
jgi:hypothetical protein